MIFIVINCNLEVGDIWMNGVFSFFVFYIGDVEFIYLFFIFDMLFEFFIIGLFVLLLLDNNV